MTISEVRADAATPQGLYIEARGAGYEGGAEVEGTELADGLIGEQQVMERERYGPCRAGGHHRAQPRRRRGLA